MEDRNADQLKRVLAFWFEELTPEQWWKSDPEVDGEIARRFTDLHRAAVACELSSWRATPAGRLAEVLVVDQFSRNIHRGRPEAFLYDPMALVLAQEAVRGGYDQKLPIERRAFLYMPFMHSESELIHRQAVELFSIEGMEENLEFEVRHKAIIDRFGRYPHRNAILGRVSTPEELEFLEQPGSSF